MLKRNAALVVAFAVTSALIAPPAFATTYSVDPSHTSVIFKVRHLLGKVTGRFHKFDGTVDLDPVQRDAVSVTGSIDVASIDTDEAKRDEHLRSPDFFDAAKFPKITFKAGALSAVNADKTKAKLTGELTMHGVTRPIVLDVEWFGTVTDPWGNKKAGFDGTTKLNRKDFGMVWNKALDSGGLLVGDEVEIELHVEVGEAKAK